MSALLQANHGGIRGRIPKKFVEDPDAFCADASNMSDDDDLDDSFDSNSLAESEKVGKVSSCLYSIMICLKSSSCCPPCTGFSLHLVRKGVLYLKALRLLERAETWF